MKALFTLLASFAGMAAVVYGADATLKVSDKSPPAEVSDSMKQLVQAQSVQVLEGGRPLYEFWWRKEIPLKEKPQSAAKALDAVDEITFLGVASVGAGRRDYKDNEIPPGAYTIRFGLQPQDGDHLGTAEFPYFAVLIPAKADVDPAGIKTYKAMVRASGKATPAGHPAVLSLRPVTAESEKAPALTSPAAEHKAIRFNLPAKAGDSGATLAFELVYEGKYKH